MLKGLYPEDGSAGTCRSTPRNLERHCAFTEPDLLCSPVYFPKKERRKELILLMGAKQSFKIESGRSPAREEAHSAVNTFEISAFCFRL
jgi:hypothetical protein